MEQHNLEMGTKRDLVLYRLETARNDLTYKVQILVRT